MYRASTVTFKYISSECLGLLVSHKELFLIDYLHFRFYQTLNVSGEIALPQVCKYHCHFTLPQTLQQDRNLRAPVIQQ